MKRKILQLSIAIVILAIFVMFVQGLKSVEKKLTVTSTRLDSLLAEQRKPWSPDPYWSHTWFDLGKAYHQVVYHGGGDFYVSDLKTSYRENGFLVTGTIANLDALSYTLLSIPSELFS